LGGFFGALFPLKELWKNIYLPLRGKGALRRLPQGVAPTLFWAKAETLFTGAGAEKTLSSKQSSFSGLRAISNALGQNTQRRIHRSFGRDKPISRQTQSNLLVDKLSSAKKPLSFLASLNTGGGPAQTPSKHRARDPFSRKKTRRCSLYTKTAAPVLRRRLITKHTLLSTPRTRAGSFF